MRDQYLGNRGVRPQEVGSCERRGCGSARLFVCVECRGQALICSKCDRGQIYCAGDCALRARRRRQRAAGARYQTSRRGRFTHAERARRYRARSKNVTHQGSPPPPPDDQLHPGSTPSASDAAAADDRPPRVDGTAIGAPAMPRSTPSAVPASSRPAWRVPQPHTIAEEPIMVTSPAIEAQILRYYHVEKWTIGTMPRSCTSITAWCDG